MAADVETSGIIVKASRNSCVVSVKIDGCAKSFSVSKTIFYVFSVKCEGDLTNLVEEDTEVELSYRLRPGSAPTIVAVWLGEKPAICEDSVRLIPVYDRKGILNELIVDTDFGQVYVNKRVTFRDGQRETDGVVLNEQVMFDAVPVKAVHFFDAVGLLDVHLNGPFYKASCAWIGSKPRLVDRFYLGVDETEDVELEDDVCGIVVVIPNDVVALVDVEVESFVLKVMLFRSSFRRVYDIIQDCVDVGDRVCMRLRYAIVSPGRKHWFAVSAIKVCDEVLIDDIADSESVKSDDVYVGDDDVLKTECVVKTDGDDVKPCGIKAGRDGVVNTDRFETKGGRKRKETVDFDKCIDLTSYTGGESGNSPFEKENKTGKVVDELVEDTVGVRSVNTEAASVTDHFDKDCWTLYSDPPLEGVLSYRDPNGCITFGSLKVLLDPLNFYIDGEPCKVDAFAPVAAGCIVVSFEAVLMRLTDKKISEFSHEATCAWIGTKPALTAIASSLSSSNFQLLEEPNRSFYGKVTKICLPWLALLVLSDESTVSVHVNGFVTGPQYPAKGPSAKLISSYVRFDDWVQFKVSKRPRLAKRLTAHDAGPVFSPELWAKLSPGIALLRGSNELDRLRNDGLGRKPSFSKIKSPDANPGPAVCVASPFKCGGLAQDRAYLINCTGTLRKGYGVLSDKELMTVQHVFGSTTITDKTVYASEGKILSLDSIASRCDHVIHFDAQASMSPNSNSGFIVTRMWEGTKRPASEVVLFSDLKLFEGVATRWCPAEIVSIPLHDCAIASVTGVPILVPFDSLVTLQEVNMACSTIDTFLNVGDFVALWFERRKFPGEISGSYYRAVSCWSLSKGGEKISTYDEIRVAEPRLRSWFSLWGFGEFFCKGNVRQIGARYYVDDTSTSKWSGGIMKLDTFEKNKVCVNGELVEMDTFQFQSNEGDEVTFHLGHGYVRKVSNDKSRKMFEPEGFYAACSWLGKEAALEHCLRNVLAVTKDLVCSNSVYEVIVESFPTPTYAICRLGYLPVLVPLPKITLGGELVGVEDVNLRKGDKIVVNVLVKDVQNKKVLVSNAPKYRRVKDIAYEDVLRNVSGKLTSLPCPTGLIKAFNGDFEVSFELCNARSTRKGRNTDMMTWLEDLKGKLCCGTVLYFSALKSDAETAPYRAFEVSFD